MELHANNLSLKEQETFALIAERETCGVTVKQFCELKCISEPTFYYWHKKYHVNRRKSLRQSGGGFSMLLLKEERDLGITKGQLLAEYKGVKFYRQSSVEFLKALT
jgi:hypothetical protein